MNLLWFAAGGLVGTIFGMMITCAIVAGRDLSNDEERK